MRILAHHDTDAMPTRLPITRPNGATRRVRKSERRPAAPVLELTTAGQAAR